MELCRNEESIMLKGRLDSASAPLVQQQIEQMVGQEPVKLVLDLAECSYVSSAGLRVFINLLRRMSSQGGSMVLTNVPDSVMTVLDMTGFSNILTIE